MTRKIVFLYSGQGSQYYQMGRELWQKEPIYKTAFKRYEAIAGPIDGQLLSEILFEKPLSDSAQFDRLAQTHPMILAISLALTDLLNAYDVFPDELLGYSLGETTAAVVSGVLSVEEAFWALRSQAAIFEKFAQPGRLIAVLEKPSAALSVISKNLRDKVELAAFNAPCHCVLAVAQEHCELVCADLSVASLSFLPLPVRFAFHSSLIDSVAEHFLDIGRQISFAQEKLPVWSCATADRWASPKSDHFWTVARQPIRFAETIEPSTSDPTAVLIDVGSSGTLAGLVRLNGPNNCKALPLMNQFGRDLKTLNDLLEQLK